MNPQIIKTDSGEELVVLPRRDYDAMLARLGDEEAEDRMTERLIAEGRQRIASGEEGLVRAGPDGRPPKPEEHLPTGARLRAVRRSFGRSQVELADDAGITQGYLSDIETGRKNPTRDVVERIAKALGIEPDTL